MPGNRLGGDRSLQLLLIAFIATGSIAGSVMAIAYSAGRDVPVEPAQVDVLPQNAAELPAATEPEPEPTDFTEYIDNLLASTEKNITGFS
jgi:hypothetical protein